LKAADQGKPDQKVFFHLNKSPKSPQLPKQRSQVVPGGPSESFSDDDEPGEVQKGSAEDKKQISLEDIKLSQGTAADLLRAYECASIQDAPRREKECSTVLERLRTGQGNSFELFQKAWGIAQVKRIERLQSEIMRLTQSEHFPKDAQSDEREAQPGAPAQQSRGCCYFCNK